MFSFHLFTFYVLLQSAKRDIILSILVPAGLRAVFAHYVPVYLLLGPCLMVKPLKTEAGEGTF